MIRIWLFLLLLFCLKPFAFSQNHSTEPINLIFDIDWSTFYPVDPDQQDENTISFEGKLFRPTDHLAYVIEKIITQHPQVRIIFFSGGQKSRNEAVLKSVSISDGRSLYKIAYRIFSFEDLTEIAQNETLPFTVRFKKVVSSLLPQWNPDRTILIDDQTDFAVHPLIAVESMGTFNFQQHFDPKRVNEPYYPPDKKAWQKERDKALSWLKYIEDALEETQRTGQPFSAIIKKLWVSPLAPTCQKLFSF